MLSEAEVKIIERASRWARARFRDQELDDLASEATYELLNYKAAYPAADPFTIRRSVFGHLRNYCVENRTIRVPHASANRLGISIRCVTLSNTSSDLYEEDSAITVNDDDAFGINDLVKEYRISEIELAILNLKVAGFSPDEIANKLDIGVSTVHYHIANVRERIENRD